MASEVQNGTAVLYGIGNSGSAITISGYATFLLDTIKPTHKFDLETVKQNGFDVSLIAANARYEAEIVWTPSGTTKANALATAVFLQPLACVTLANFAVSSLNGAWIYKGDESMELGQGVAKMTIPLMKYADATQNASLAVTAS